MFPAVNNFYGIFLSQNPESQYSFMYKDSTWQSLTCQRWRPKKGLWYSYLDAASLPFDEQMALGMHVKVASFEEHDEPIRYVKGI